MCTQNIRLLSFSFSIFLFHFKYDCSYQTYCTLNAMHWNTKLTISNPGEKIKCAWLHSPLQSFTETTHIHHTKAYAMQLANWFDPRWLVCWLQITLHSKLQFNLDNFFWKGMERISLKELSQIIVFWLPFAMDHQAMPAMLLNILNIFAWCVCLTPRVIRIQV